MNIIDYKSRYSGLTQAQIRELASESSEFRVETEMLYRKVSGSPLNKNCTECWVDAYAVIIKSDPDKVERRAARKFDLKAGALLIDRVKGDNSKMCSMHNITDELAIYHLRTNPKCIKYFSRYPENWQELVAASSKKTKPQTQSGKKSKTQSGKKSSPSTKKQETKTETVTEKPAEA